ncbi:MAG TPA: hypothetical protein VIJ25_05600 [Methylococcales bacterium]
MHGYGLVILDEAHKTRSRQGFGKNAGGPNELLGFITAIAARADHVLLGTATPIQTNPEDLWGLVRVLHQGKGNFVLGNDFARWHKPDEVLPILSGTQEVTDLANAWELLRSPLPPVNSTADNPVRVCVDEHPDVNRVKDIHAFNALFEGGKCQSTCRLC